MPNYARYPEYTKDFVKQFYDFNDVTPIALVNFLHSCLDREREKLLDLLDKRMPLETDERKTRDTGDFIIESYDEKQGYNAAIRQINLTIKSLR